MPEAHRRRWPCSTIEVAGITFAMECSDPWRDVLGPGGVRSLPGKRQLRRGGLDTALLRGRVAAAPRASLGRPMVANAARLALPLLRPEVDHADAVPT